MIPFIPKVSIGTENRLLVVGNWRQGGLGSNWSMVMVFL